MATRTGSSRRSRKAFPAGVMDGDIGPFAPVFNPFRIRPFPGATGRKIESMTFHYLFKAHHWSPGILSRSHRLLVSYQVETSAKVL